MTYLQYFGNILVKNYKIIAKTIFLESTWKWLLKDVQDRLPKPTESR